MPGPVVAVVGEALIDLPEVGGGLEPRPGGSPLNVAIGLARLGRPTAFFGRFSHDRYGVRLRSHADASGVDLRWAVDAAEPSTLARVHLDKRGAAQYAFTVDGTADFAWTDAELAPLPAGAQVVHFGSLASWLPPGDAVILRRLEALRAAGRVLLSYDPNVRPQLQPDASIARAQLEAAIRLAHIVKASDEDVRYLYGERSVAQVCEHWLTLGPALVVITRGADGPFAATGHITLQRPAHRVRVVDTVGAGDAFTSGLLDALIQRDIAAPARLAATSRDLAAIVDEASLVAAITCTRPGADPPTRAELDALPKLTARVHAR